MLMKKEGMLRQDLNANFLAIACGNFRTRRVTIFGNSDFFIYGYRGQNTYKQSEQESGAAWPTFGSHKVI